MTRIKITAFGMAILMALSMTTMAFAEKGDKNDPYTDLSDLTQFPKSGPGSVHVEKSAVWANEEAGIAKVTIGLSAVQDKRGVDAVLVLDTSGSMGSGQGKSQEDLSDFLLCDNDSHWKEFRFEKELPYYVSTDSWKNMLLPPKTVKSNFILKGLAHTTDAGVVTLPYVKVTVVDPPTEHNGQKITNYAYVNNKAKQFDPFDQSEYTFAPGKLTVNDGTYDDHSYKNWLVNGTSGTGNIGFAGAQSTISNITLPNRPGAAVLGGISNDNSCIHRMNYSKTASKEFVDQFLGGEDNHNNLAVVTFSDAAQPIDSSKNFYTTNDIDEIKAELDGMTAQGFTNYIDALKEAEKLLKQGDSKRQKYVIFMSDGAPYVNQRPQVEQDVNAAIASLHSEADAVYAVGVNLPNADAKRILQSVAKSPGTYIEVTDDNMSDLEGVFTKIAVWMGVYAKNAVITDRLGEAFEFVPRDDPTYPLQVLQNGVKIDTDNVSIQGDELTWNLGLIPTDIQLIFYIRIKDGTPAGEYPTNNGLEVLYENTEENYCKLQVEDPTLIYDRSDLPDPVDGIKVMVEHYRKDAVSGVETFIDGASRTVTADVETDMGGWRLSANEYKIVSATLEKLESTLIASDSIVDEEVVSNSTQEELTDSLQGEEEESSSQAEEAASSSTQEVETGSSQAEEVPSSSTQEVETGSSQAEEVPSSSTQEVETGSSQAEEVPSSSTQEESTDANSTQDGVTVLSKEDNSTVDQETGSSTDATEGEPTTKLFSKISLYSIVKLIVGDSAGQPLGYSNMPGSSSITLNADEPKYTFTADNAYYVKFVYTKVDSGSPDRPRPGSDRQDNSGTDRRDTDYVRIEDAPVPLAQLPDLTTIHDDEVPLGPLPATGGCKVAP